MYKTYEFTYAGIPATAYGLFIADIGSKTHSDNSLGNKADIVETRLPHRITPLHYGVNYTDEPLSFKLIFGAEEEMDRYQIQEVGMWLTGYQEYQWLTIDQPDMEYIRLKCLITEVEVINVAWLPVAFEASVTCDCPYGYSYPFEETITFTNNMEYTFHNYSTIRENLKPELVVTLDSGITDFSISNETTGTTMSFSGLPSGGITITADNENCILTNDDYDLYDYCNFVFFELASGDNELVFTGSGTAVISGMYMYNMGA